MSEQLGEVIRLKAGMVASDIGVELVECRLRREGPRLHVRIDIDRATIPHPERDGFVHRHGVESTQCQRGRHNQVFDPPFVHGFHHVRDRNRGYVHLGRFSWNRRPYRRRHHLRRQREYRGLPRFLRRPVHRPSTIGS